MPSQPQNTASRPLFRFAFYGLAIGMALIHVFITFRGLSSADGMEQAQMAREIARGNHFKTKVIRPYAWAALEQAGKEAPPGAMLDITQPPLQPALWGSVFRLLPFAHDYTPNKDGSIYLLDRVIACFGVTGLLLTILWTHGTAKKLFDDKVAGITALGLLVCKPLWDLSVSGSSVALLMPLVALGFRLLISVIQKAHRGEHLFPWLLGLGVVVSLLPLTHWLALWLSLGFIFAVIASLPTKRSAALWVGFPLIVVLIGWGWWMQQRCGDPLGGAKTLFQTHLLSLDASALQRHFSVSMPPVEMGELLRKILQNWQNHLSEIYAYLGYSIPAMLFVIALIHRFRRTETILVRRSILIVGITTLLAMGLIGLPDKLEDDNQFYLLLIPTFSIFGVAMLSVLWARLQPAGNGIWTHWGFAILALGLSALPLLNHLPAQIKLGLTLRNRIYPHWPPYVPDRVSMVKRLVEPNEIVFSDAPWFVAWYADTPAVWVPIKRDDYALMKKLSENRGNPVAGFVMTPVSTQMTHLHDAFTGPYSEWPDLLFRGPMLAFDREFLPRPDFEFNIPVPLVAVPVGAKENLSIQMTFFTDKNRALKD